MSERWRLLALVAIGSIGWVASDVVRGSPRISHRANSVLRLAGPLFAVACCATALLLLWNTRG